MKFRLATYSHIETLVTSIGNIKFDRENPNVYDTDTELGEALYKRFSKGGGVKVIKVKEGDPLAEKEPVTELEGAKKKFSSPDTKVSDSVKLDAQKQLERLNLRLSELLEAKKVLKARKPKKLREYLSTLMYSDDLSKVKSLLETLKDEFFLGEYHTREQAAEFIKQFLRSVDQAKAEIASVTKKIKFYERRLIDE